jgi:WD40 repeat protein
VWEVSSRAIKRTLTAHEDGVTDFYFGVALAYSHDDTLLATGAGDGWVVVWDAATGERRAALNTKAKGTLNIAFAPDGKHLTITSWGDEFYPPDDYRGSQTFWSITNLDAPRELTGVASIGACVKFPTAVSVDGRYWTDNLLSDCQQVDRITIWEIYGDIIDDTYGSARGVGEILLGDNWSSSQIEAITFNEATNLVAFVHRRTPQPSEESDTLPSEEIDLQVFRWEPGIFYTMQHIATNSDIPLQGVHHLHFMNDHQGTWVQYISAADNNLWQWNIETGVTTVIPF